MRVDVVIVGHESADHIDRAIGKLPSIADVVLIDNASTDTTASLARSAGARVIVNDVNAGFAAAANQGATLGDADAILFLNPDAAIDAANLARLLAHLDAQPELAVVSPRIQYDDGTEQRVAWPFPSSRGAWREAFGLHKVARAKSAPGFVIGACFLVRRAVFEQLGGFDARYWLYGEETDLCRRALDAGWRVEVADDVWAQHVGGASRDTAPTLVAEHFERGGERFVADHEHVPGLVSYRIAGLVGATIRACVPGSRERRELHGRRMRRYAHILTSSPTSVAIDSPTTAAPGHSIVVCSLEAWDDVWRRNQFLVRELLAADPHLRVLFVEPPFDWLHELRRTPRTRHRRRGLRSVSPDGRTLAFEPGKVAPRLLGPIADRSLRRQVIRATEHLGFNVPTLWINDAAFAGLLATPWPAVYDITDDWLLASGPARVRRRLENAEKVLLRDSRAVVVCSPALAASRRSARPDLRVVPNAVDVDHFRRPQDRPADLPPAPVAVYVGTLHEDRLDVGLVVALAASLPQVQVVLVGPNSLRADSVARLGALSNIHVLGARPYEHVPGYLQHADVVVVPHVVSPFTESLDPIKAYECVAVGRPTIATPVAGFRDADAPVRVAAADSFVVSVERALAGSHGDLPGVVPTWSERAEDFVAALDAARRTRESR